jgi:Mg2+-importing ATPase
MAVRDLCRFTLLFAPINTLADLATFHALSATLAAPGDPAKQALFHAGWLIENLLTQVCAIYLLRTRRASSPRNRASGPLLAAVVALTAIAVLLPLGAWAGALGLAAPPAAFYPYLAAIVAGFCVLTTAAKSGYARAGGTIP